MASYVCLGFVNSTSKKEEFQNNFIKFMSYHRNYIKNYCFEYPLDSKYTEWEKDEYLPNDFNGIIKKFMNFEFSKITFDYNFNNKLIEHIILEIEQFNNNSIGIHISIPEESIFDKTTLDNLEQYITDFLIQNIEFGFDYAYCDNEAYINNDFNKVINNDNIFSILVIHSENIKVKFSNWKIDGYSKRIN